MMTKVLVQEAKGTNVRVHAVVAFDAVKTRDRSAQVVDDWLTAEDIGTYIVRLFDRTGRDLDKSIHTLHGSKEVAWLYS